jgi:hypothetical protein
MPFAAQHGIITGSSKTGRMERYCERKLRTYVQLITWGMVIGKLTVTQLVKNLNLKIQVFRDVVPCQDEQIPPTYTASHPGSHTAHHSVLF